MDIGKAFGFVTKDETWITKVLIGGLVTIIPLIGSLVVSGYSLRVAQNVARGSERPLPEWNEFGDFLVRGFLAAVIQLVYLLPALILYFVFIALTIGAGAMTADSDGQGGAGALIGLCLLPLLLIVALACGAAALCAIARYLATDEFGQAFRFAEVFASLRANLGNIVMLLVTAIVAGLVGGLGVIACGVGVLFTAFYAQLVIGHALGQILPLLSPARDIGGPTGYTPPPSY